MDVGFLYPLFERPGPWASVYFPTPTGTEDAGARQDLSARGACDQLAEQGADDDTCRAVFEALTALPRSHETAGRAVFAAGGEVVLDPALAVEPPGGTQAWWSPLPHATPLLELAGGRPSCLVAYVDRVGADFEMSSPLGTYRVGGAQGEEWPIHRTASQEWSEQHFQVSVENTWERNAEVIADALAACQEETGADLLVLAGDPRERHAVQDRLPQHLRRASVETDHGGRAPGSRSPLLDKEVAELRAAHAHRVVTAAMERFSSARTPDDQGRVHALEGVPALVDAARERRIASLLVHQDSPELHREVWAGHEPDQLAMRRTELTDLGDPEPVAVRADDALLRAAAATGAEVLAVPSAAGEVQGVPVDGVGALLRWPAGGPLAEPPEETAA